MSTFPDIYETVDNITSTGIQYFFFSEGKSDIVKAVQYAYILDFQGKRVFNLGFGDYDPDTDTISDDLTTNNGDPYKVFHTVLNTIPRFFTTYEDEMMMVRGSDSTQDFMDNCRPSSRKKCRPNECKNAHRRINIYRGYVDKNFDNLTKEYKFYGGSADIENQMLVEDYIKGKQYITVLLTKKS
jgi:hypothetical protein